MIRQAQSDATLWWHHATELLNVTGRLLFCACGLFGNLITALALSGRQWLAAHPLEQSARELVDERIAREIGNP